MLMALNVDSDIAYVGGTINGETRLFEYREMLGQWVAEVDQAADSTYRLDLELIDEAGNRSRYADTVVYFLPTFIFDRTGEDIRGHTRKAYINAADLDRIERNTELIAGYIKVPAAVKSWKRGDIPRISDYRRIRDNVEKIRLGYAIRADTPKTPVQPLNTYRKWNDLEHILHDVFWIYMGNLNNYIYCGEDVGCGEGTGLI